MEKDKARQEKEERARKSLEDEWLKVSRRTPRDNDDLDDSHTQESSTNQGQARRHVNPNHNGVPTAEYMYVDDIEPEYRHSQQERKDSERLWQEHIRSCLMSQSHLRRRNRSNLWDQVQEGFEGSAGADVARPTQSRAQTNPYVERQARRTAQRQQKAFEETYRERAGLQYEARRAKERTFRPSSL